MKKTTIVFALLLGSWNFLCTQVCIPNGISTNPENPINPNPPTNSPEHWLNEFEWYANDGTALVDIAIHDMFTLNPNHVSMTNPFSDQNANYSHLVNVPFEDLDMLPEDGWELISVNLGSYPNGEVLTEQIPPQQSDYSQIPYILLYNKYRGILRLFANSLTGLQGGYESASITLRFENGEEVSGLLRHNGGYDLALDQKTETREVVSVVRHPNNDRLWFWADFQVGYDACTCNFQSNLRLEFRFVNTMTINMVSNSVSTEIATVDANGNATLPSDFLANVQYNEGFEGAGTLVYNNINVMIDQYIERLEQVEAYNSGRGAATKKIKRKKFILKALKFVAEAGLNATLTQPLADSLAVYANDVLEVVGLGFIKVKGEPLRKEAKKLLGYGFDWLSKEWVTEDASAKPTPTMPTASISSSTFNGTIDNPTNTPGPNLFNPGTYPSGTGNISINEHNYPVYNEVLGLFALLETPEVNYYRTEWATIENHDIGFYESPSGSPRLQSELSVLRNRLYKFWLAQPLKFVFNPAAGIDVPNVNIDAALVIQRPMSSLQQNGSGPITDINPLPGQASGIAALYNYSYTNTYAGQNQTVFGVDNLYFADSDSSLYSSKRDVQEVVEFNSPFLPLSNFNTMVSSLHMMHHENYTLRQSPPANQPNNTDYLLEIQQNFLLPEFSNDLDALEDYSFFLKLNVTMPFIQPNSDGSIRFMEQVFTYQLDPTLDLIAFVPSAGNGVPTPWSVTLNPTGGMALQQPNLVLQEKEWSSGDFDLWGGPSNQSLQVHAIETIQIIGNQTLAPEMETVEFIAGQEIVVAPGTDLIGDFTLRLDDFVQMTSSPTPPVTNAFLDNFCEGLTPNDYNANQAAPRSLLVSNKPLPPSASTSKPVLNIWPNPASTQTTVEVQGIYALQSLELLDARGRLIQKTEGRFSLGHSKVIIDTSNLSDGVYSIRCYLTSGEVATQQLIVLH